MLQRGASPAEGWEAGRAAFRMLKVEVGLILKIHVS